MLPSIISFAAQKKNLHLRNDVRRIIYIYEKSTVRLASVGLAQARPNESTNTLNMYDRRTRQYAYEYVLV